MHTVKTRPRIPLPRDWSGYVKSAVLHVISLAQVSVAYTRGWAANSVNARVRLKTENNRLRATVAQLRDEMRIKDARMARIDPVRRPHYRPEERMSILELRAVHGWSLKQTAKAFLVSPATIASWMRRVDEGGPSALLRLAEPVNKFPEFVGYVVRRLRTLCPTMGKVKIAETLARAGLHLGVTTVGRMLKQTGTKPPDVPQITNTGACDDNNTSDRVVTAKYPNHLYHIDLTTVATRAGFWVPWPGNSLLQRWPFCWWLAVVIDHHSRKAVGFAIFRKQPSAIAVQKFLDRTFVKNHARPRHMVSDKGRQFWCDSYKQWCKARKIKPRFGAVGRKGSIALVERFILSVKQECTRLISVPLRRREFREELCLYLDWHNQWRPHTALGGRTPNEIYEKRRPANRMPRFEPRTGWPRPSPCAAPRTLVKGQPGVRLTLHVDHLGGRKHLPIVTVRRAA